MTCSHKLPTPSEPEMEDRNTLAADCVVVSCCCQCLIIQILFFFLLKLLYKLLKRMKNYTKKFGARKMRANIMQIDLTRLYGEDSFRILGNFFRIHVQDICFVQSLSVGCCMADIESVLDDFSSRGEFAFGSCWGSELESSRRVQPYLDEEEAGYDVLFDRIAWRC